LAVTDRQTAGQTGGDFIIDGIGEIRQFIRRYDTVPLGSHHHHRIFGFDIRDMAHIDHGKIHAYPACDLCPLSFHQHVAGIGQLSGVAVGISHRNRGDHSGPGRDMGAAVRHSKPFGHGFDLGDFGNNGHGRGEC